MTRLSDPTAELQAALDGGIAAGIPGISAAVVTREARLWTGTAGLANLSSDTAVSVNTLFGIGSITKIFVAVVILQLVEEGRLSLDATAGGILGSVTNDIANAEKATIAQLLNHTGGVPSWEDDPAWIRDGRGASLTVDRLWGKQDTLQYIRGHAPLAAPGEKYAYANTNYTLLGSIVEKLSGKDIVGEIHRRVLRPLGLTSIFLEGFEPLPRDRLSHRYHWATSEFRRNAGVNAAFRETRADLIDASPSNLSVEWAAGGMVATAVDLALFGGALRDGKLLRNDSMAFMTDWFPGADAWQVGHNIFRVRHPSGLNLIGHDGDVLGFSASLYWIENADAVVAMLCNVGTMHCGKGVVSVNSVAKSGKFLDSVLRLTWQS